MTQEFHLKVPEKKNIAVIGGGIFGVMGGMKLAECGFHVTIMEKATDILMGASYINQNRLHMGYHYPRSDETARLSNVYQRAFIQLFPSTVVDNFSHYYCLAKEGSRITPEQYVKFCDRIGLPYTIESPDIPLLNKEKVVFSMRVPEKVYDTHLLRKTLQDILEKDERINVMLSTEVTEITRKQDGFAVNFKKNDRNNIGHFDAILNATYSNINKMIALAGFETKTYEYELCEVPVIRVPWKKQTGCGIFDGPFFGVLPFGFSNEYLLYDVELSVLEKCCGIFPQFKHDVSFYDAEETRKERFQKYIQKAQQFIPDMKNCQHLYSSYITRIILPDHDNDDARPTDVLNHGYGFWTIFAGKISAAIPAAERIAEEMCDFFI